MAYFTANHNKLTIAVPPAPSTRMHLPTEYVNVRLHMAQANEDMLNNKESDLQNATIQKWPDIFGQEANGNFVTEEDHGGEQAIIVYTTSPLDDKIKREIAEWITSTYKKRTVFQKYTPETDKYSKPDVFAE